MANKAQKAAALRQRMIFDAIDGGKFNALELAAAFNLTPGQVRRYVRQERQTRALHSAEVLEKARRSVQAEIERSSRPISQEEARRMIAEGRAYGSPALKPAPIVTNQGEPE